MFPSSPNQPQHMIHHNNSNPPRPTRQQQPLPRHPYNLYPPTYQQPPFTDPSLYVVQQQFLGPHTHSTLGRDTLHLGERHTPPWGEGGTPPWGEGGLPLQHYHSSLKSTGPSQAVAQQYQQWYQPPGPGPSHNQNSRGGHRTEARYDNHYRYVSSRMISTDHSTSTHPANAQMGAFNNTATGRVWRPPPRNPLVVNNDWQRARPKPYERDRATRKKCTRKINLSMYQVPITGSERNATEHSSNVPTPTSATAGATENTANVDKQEQRTEDEDFDTISLGSDTD